MSTKIKLPSRKPLHRTTRLAVLSVLAILFLAVLAQTYLAYQTPTTKQAHYTTVEYTNTGRFSYLVYLKNNTVYNRTILQPGTGIFYTQLVNNISATFTYTFDIDINATVNGTCMVQAIIQTKQWNKVYTLVPQTPFNAQGEHATTSAHFSINHSYYELILNKINTETGVPAQNPVLLVQAVITVTAETSKGNIFTSFLPSINMTLGTKTIDVSKNLVTSTPGALSDTFTVNIPDAASARNNWSVATVVFLLGAITAQILTTNTVEDKNLEVYKKIHKKYQDWMVEADKQPDSAKARVIYLHSIEDLARTGEELGKPIIHYLLQSETTKTHMFFIIDDVIFYEFDLPLVK